MIFFYLAFFIGIIVVARIIRDVQQNSNVQIQIEAEEARKVIVQKLIDYSLGE